MEPVVMFKIIGCVIVLRHTLKKNETPSALNNFSHDVLKVWQSVCTCVGTQEIHQVFVLRKFCFCFCTSIFYIFRYWWLKVHLHPSLLTQNFVKIGLLFQKLKCVIHRQPG